MKMEHYTDGLLHIIIIAKLLVLLEFGMSFWFTFSLVQAFSLFHLKGIHHTHFN